ncbi:archease [Nocardia pseudobrasiliensis]|uniref:SHS2 domain-containing protein n=1 Tax=Nocardia pseudobrasiliensis TaxID=45979 RepID=A0A370HPQ6_9NOCA|nr:archease [Nocardia pseudobrasiliensis]RDI60447.1 SHS2 domain-containing protein [Nocardia pseudobrasiliensis]
MAIRSAGHVSVPHTADLRIEAWAPTQAQCLVEAVNALVDSFIDRPRPHPSSTVEWTLLDDHAENLLADLLDEVIYQMEVFSHVPVATTVESTPNGWRVRFEMAELAEATACGAMPKAVSLHDIRLRPVENGWRCVVTIDV